MKAEIITIGDEILIGQIVDTNSTWMAQQLTPLGWEVTRSITIPDTKEAIYEALDDAFKRADLILMTGGLGPTKDDVTKQSLCEYFGTELIHDDASYANVERIFNHLKRPISEVNKRQALIPSNAEALHNAYGTAPGLLFKHQGATLVCMPGVPYEMKGILTNHVFDRIQNESKDIIKHQTLVVSGMPESIIAETIAHVEDNLPVGVKIAYLPNYNVVRLRVTSRGTAQHAVQEHLNQVIQAIENLIAPYIIAHTDKQIQEIIGELLIERNQTVSFAESCTGGKVASLITSTPGSSAYFPGSVVTYSYENKTSVLGVTPDMLWSTGAVSQEVVEHMATAVREKNQTDFALAISGIAGPSGGTKDKPVGTVWMAVCDKNSVYSRVYHLTGNREQNIDRSANLGLELLRKKIVGDL